MSENPLTQTKEFYCKISRFYCSAVEYNTVIKTIMDLFVDNCKPNQLIITLQVMEMQSLMVELHNSSAILRF